jgi:trans-2,3-dihydro-3-hydroxyanthranilate isomerase
MGKTAFSIVDVFAEEKYTGNQLAVILNGQALITPQMQRIANEMHFSETTFICSPMQSNGGYDVRIFTPAIEVPFAGHPTLGTAHVIRQNAGRPKPETVILNLKVGQIPVTFRTDKAGNEVAWMKQKPPTFSRTFEPRDFCRVLNLAEADFSGDFPIQEVSTGLAFIIVPLKTLDAIKRARVNYDAQLSLLKENQAGILVFAPQTYKKGNDLNVRVFVDAYGIVEDPATGSGNGCLAGYLAKHRFFGASKVNARVEQGCEIGRPSLLHLQSEETHGEIEVNVGGRVIPVAEGELA